MFLFIYSTHTFDSLMQVRLVEVVNVTPSLVCPQRQRLAHEGQVPSCRGHIQDFVCSELRQVFQAS